MKDLLAEIQSIPGIIGGFVFHSQNGVMAHDLPPIFKEQKLVKLGKMISKIYTSGRSNFPELTEITLYYEETLVVIRQVDSSVYLIVLCETDLNLNLLTMSLNLILNDLTCAAEPNAEASGRAIAEPDVTAEDLLENGPLSDVLKRMQAPLAKVVGPMAKIIFMDALTRWISMNPASPGTPDKLDNLMNILDEEINDPDKARHYRKLVSHQMAAGNHRNLWRGGER